VTKQFTKITNSNKNFVSNTLISFSGYKSKKDKKKKQHTFPKLQHALLTFLINIKYNCIEYTNNMKKEIY